MTQTEGDRTAKEQCKEKDISVRPVGPARQDPNDTLPPAPPGERHPVGASGRDSHPPIALQTAGPVVVARPGAGQASRIAEQQPPPSKHQ